MKFVFNIEFRWQRNKPWILSNMIYLREIKMVQFKCVAKILFSVALKQRGRKYGDWGQRALLRGHFLEILLYLLDLCELIYEGTKY